MGIIYNLSADSAWLDERGDYRDSFTDTVDRNWSLPAADVCLLSPYGESLAFACLITRGEMVATFKRRVRFTDLVSLGHELGYDEVLARMPRNLRRHVDIRRSAGGTLPPTTWTALLALVKGLRPAAAREIERIETLARNPAPVFRGRAADTMSLERDALGLALLAAGIDRTSLLTWQEQAQPSAFLRGLSLQMPIEDRLVDYDASVFGNWELVRRDPVGVAVFEEMGNQLTVINVNRTDVEHALGVDLVYYSHAFESFVLVQYKRMRKERGRNGYRPDSALPEEIARMRALPGPSDSGDPFHYRLHPGTCYLKLCPDGEFRPRDGELIRGMYLPLDYWDALDASGAILGPRGGTAVTFENASRHINSTLFASLVRDGWVGSRGESSGVLRQVVEELLQAGHSVTLAEYREVNRRP